VRERLIDAGQFIVTGFQELGPGALEALHVAEELDGEVPGSRQQSPASARRSTRRRRSGPVMTSTLAIAPSLAPVQTPLLAPVLTSPARRPSPDGYQPPKRPPH
jgi:hypothetical protein